MEAYHVPVKIRIRSLSTLYTNSGTNWTSANTGLTDIYVFSLAVSSGNGGSGTTLFARASDGVFLSTNSGSSWTQINTGLISAAVRALAVSGTSLFAGTWGAGVWRRPLSDMISSVPLASNQVPREFNLSQNYPNPFNPTTTIGYALPHRSHVTLTVFNTLGQQVAQVVNADIDAGYHEIQFNANNLASGVYFYRMQAGSYVETKSLLLIR